MAAPARTEMREAPDVPAAGDAKPAPADAVGADVAAVGAAAAVPGAAPSMPATAGMPEAANDGIEGCAPEGANGPDAIAVAAPGHWPEPNLPKWSPWRR